MNKPHTLAIIILEHAAARILVEDKPLAENLIKREIGQAVEINGFDFIDWLRSYRGSIIGFRAHLYGDAVAKIKTAKLPPYAVFKDGCVEVLFGNETSYDPAKSADQVFVDTKFYWSNNGPVFVSSCPQELLSKEP